MVSFVAETMVPEVSICSSSPANAELFAVTFSNDAAPAFARSQPEYLPHGRCERHAEQLGIFGIEMYSVYGRGFHH